jgi:cytochrome c556
MGRWKAATAGLTIALVAGAALAADVGAQIKVRHEYMHGIGKQTKGLLDGLKSDSPNLADLKAYAAALDAEAPKLASYFPPGTGIDSGLKTGAKPEIWSNPAEFKKDADAFTAAAHKLNAAAQGGDVGAIRTAFGGVGGACKACHQTFRKDEH